ncbi:MAG: ATP-binding protein [Firmicutes bacterium]|nr:ATP-binding protein [Bacillota bacterium]
MFYHSTFFRKAEAALLDEKAQKLFGLARLLDDHLEDGYERLLALAGAGPEVSRAERIATLNQALAPFCDRLSGSFPGVGVGYYSRDLDAILTYGPSKEFGSKVGITIGRDHIGWRAMESSREMVGFGSMVRGDIMNCVRPVIRDGRAIGFIWANETIEGIYRQMEESSRKSLSPTYFEPVLGLSGLLLLASASFLRADAAAGVIGGGIAGGTRETNWLDQFGRLDPPGQLDHLHRLGKVIAEFGGAVQRVGQFVTLFLNSLNTGLVILDAGGKIVFASAGLERLAGIKAGELVGADWKELAGRFEADAPAKLYNRVVTGREGSATASDRLIGPGGILPVELLAAGVRDEDGVLAGVVLMIDDARGAQEQEERLRRAEKLAIVGELAAAIAHEIRNPLTILTGSFQLIPSRLGDANFLTSFARIGEEELGRVNRTVQGLLDFARFSEPCAGEVDLNEVLKLSASFIEPYTLKNGVKLELELDSSLPGIVGDADHLKQAFLNLMMNAVQAMPEGGRLRVRTKYDRDSSLALAYLSDTGTGIAPEDQPRIFDVFFTTKPGGTGLGLPLVHRIIDEHRGFIDLESVPGRGTAFTIALPVTRGLGWREVTNEKP